MRCSQHASSPHSRVRRQRDQGPRLYLGYTQADLAKLTDRKTRTINDIERNRHPKVSKLIIGQLARVLQTKPEEFIRISEEDAA